MVSVSLELVLFLPDFSTLLPKEFAALFASIKDEKDTLNREELLVTADWCLENGEEYLSRALRYVGKRTEIDLSYRDGGYRFNNLPRTVGVLFDYGGGCVNVMTLFAKLAQALRQHDEEGKLYPGEQR